MTIRHHLTDKILMAYSAGELPEAFSLVAATHLSMCDDCRARLGAFDALGGVVLDEVDAAPMADDSIEAAIARITGLAPEPRRQPNRRTGGVPGPLADYIGGDLSAVKWRPLGMGVRQAILPTARDASARLLYIPAGQAMPDHGHRGTEMTLVLQGAFCDATDRFGPGDVEVADQGMEHTPVAEDWADCVCLTASDAPLRFKGLIPRVAQPFFRI
ncbi:MAG TPA: ChrR family anti-sigma-E factor [Paracoccaceae bacterium]|nr:ChrR family anti-sigma-E factor [Paracoccaceae bacterium]